MKILENDKKYRVLSDDKVKLSNQLRAKTYEVKVDTSGFYLEEIDNLSLGNGKIYGDSESKVDMITRAYEASDRSLGIILAGKKGIGKTLFAKILANKAVDKGYPVILVNKGYQGISKFIDSIKQEVVILFDEFEKNFNNLSVDEQDTNTSTESQSSLLNLFDGISSQKRLYVITVNKLYNLNEYMLNRPGRFHYLIRLEFPKPEDITEYLHDKLDEKYYDEIPEILKFGYRVPLNYDSLRAISFELNLGTPFKEAISNLNIINIEDRYYRLQLVFSNGYVDKEDAIKMNLFSEVVNINDNGFEMTFNTKDLNANSHVMEIPGDKVTFKAYEGNKIYQHTHAGTSNSNLVKVAIEPISQKDIGFSL